MSRLILIRGLPGSGKSTMAKALTGYYHVEADQYFCAEDGRYQYDHTKVVEAHLWCQRTCKEQLRLGRSVVVSNTFTSRWELLPYINLAHEYGITYEIREAHGKFKNVHGVPDSVIQRMRDRWENFDARYFEEIKQNV